MTLVLALVCKNGIIMAADSAASFVAEGIKQPTIKIRQLGNIALWGASGHEGMIQDIEVALTTGRTADSYMKSAQHCRQQLRQVLHPVYETWRKYQVPIPQIPYNQYQTAHLLFAGFPAGEPCIIEVEPNLAIGQLEDYGHAAIGSAAQFAQARMYPHRRRFPSLEVGKVIAYRTMKEAIDMALYGVAEPIQFWIMEAPPAPGGFPSISQIRQDEEELKKILYGIDYMAEMEEEILNLLHIRTSESEEPST